MKVNFCRQCGQPMAIAVPVGEHEYRHVCNGAGGCSYVDYFNPKMVVGAIVQHEGKILLCRRAIEPCKGLWTVPAGYMEIGESSAEGAMRETFEEANASVRIEAPYAHWDIPAIGQAYILYRATLAPPLHLRLRHRIAFSSISISLRLFLEDLRAGEFRVHHGVIDKQVGAPANDPSTFTLRQHQTFTMSKR
ncbi:MAG: hypothetical protein WDW36_000544 [Sanguina aurantia]